jgi:hypothetical protein
VISGLMQPFTSALCFWATLGFSTAQTSTPPPPEWGADWTKKMASIVPQGYVCQFATVAPTMDGKLDDDIEGDAKPKPQLRTRAKLLWDADYLYIAAEMEEPHVWATLTKHDEVIFQDPDFEVFIDPNSDSHAYYEFEMNALNTGWDLFLPKPYKDGGPAQNEWEIPGLKTAVHVQGTLNDPKDRDQGWSVEIAMPWKVLSAHASHAGPPMEGEQWRVGFSRVEWQTEVKEGKYVKVPNTPEHNWIWSAQGVVDMHRPERWGYVQFTKRAPGTVKFVPDASAPARDVLQGVYYAQKDFQLKHQRWAATLDELGLKAEAKPGWSAPSLKLTTDGFTCTVSTVSLNSAVGKSQVWSIRQDALVQQVITP